MNSELQPVPACPELFDWLPQLLQTNDSMFPTGGYAHSFGLEGLVQMGFVTDRDSFAEFLRVQIRTSLRQLELPMARLAHDAALDGDMRRLLSLDEQYGAMKGALELRQASARIGSQRLQMLRGLASHALLDALENERVAGRFHTHAPIVFGVQMALSGTPVEASLIASHYQTLASLVSAAMKLLRLGQMGAQSILTACLNECRTDVNHALKVGEADIGSFQPLLDIASAHHETAYTRIFIS